MLALALALALCALVASWDYSGGFGGFDFYGQASVAQLADSPKFGNIYSEPGRIAIGEQLTLDAKAPGADPRLSQLAAAHGAPLNTVTPFCFTAFRLFDVADYGTAWNRYRMLLLLSMVVGILIFTRRLGYSFTGGLIAVALFSSQMFGPMGSLLRTGNVGSLQLGALGLVLLLGGSRAGPARQISMGALLGFAVLFKPTVAPIVVLLVVDRIAARDTRRLRLELTGAAAAGVFGVMASGVALRSLQPWKDWMAFLSQFLEHPPPATHGNYALSQLLGGGLAPVLALVTLGVAVGSIWKARRAGGRSSDARLVALGLGVALISGPLVWLHYYVLAVPLALVAMAPAKSDAAWTIARTVVAFACVVALALRPIIVVFQVNEPTTFAWIASLSGLVLFATVAAEPFVIGRKVRSADSAAVPKSREELAPG